MNTLDTVLALWSLHVNGRGWVLVSIHFMHGKVKKMLLPLSVIPQLKEVFQILGNLLNLIVW